VVSETSTAYFGTTAAAQFFAVARMSLRIAFPA
jgi:hypothetical protein